MHTDGIAYEHNNYDDYGESRKQQQFKQANKIGSISMKPHLPQLKLNVPLGLSSSEVFETFTNICKNQRF